MAYSDAKVAGTLIFVAITQFVLGVIVSEALYPGYSVSGNYISDLGVGPSSNIFNSSVFLLGLLLIIGAYFLQRAFEEYKVLTLMLVLTAIGAMGVGVFNENFGTIHTVVSFIAFLFGGLSAIFSVACSHVHKLKLLKMPFSVVAVILGLMCLGAIVLFAGKIDLGLGVGGMERMIVYPILMWGAGFGAYLIANSDKGKASRNRSNL
jgi:hypothetical membrane protein